MTKYRVLKPLPRAKVGDELSLEPIGLVRYDRVETLNIIPTDWIEDSVTEKFIEEIEEIKEGRWTPEKGERYWMIDTAYRVGELHRTIEYDERTIKAGNCFKSEATAKLVAEAVKLMYEWLHTPLEETIKTDNELWGRIYRAQNKAREAVLADDRSEA